LKQVRWRPAGIQTSFKPWRAMVRNTNFTYHFKIANPTVLSRISRAELIH
jgi:hypothetical protein